jgi:maleate isomerase
MALPISMSLRLTLIEPLLSGSIEPKEDLPCKWAALRPPEPLPAIVTSADALLEALRALKAQRVALVMPYMKPLARKVVDYLEAEEIEVTDWVALEEPDNAAVARIQGPRILAAARGLDLTKADAVVLSACVQMPSLPLIEVAETEFALPVLSASTATTFTLLRRLGLPTVLPGAGRLLQQDRRDVTEHM